MKRCFDKKGFTLIEIIVSLAIVGILIVSLLSFLGQSFSHIFSLGNRSKDIYRVQGIIEERILETYNHKPKEGNEKFSFTIEGIGKVDIMGILHSENIDYKTIKVFVPVR